MAKRKRKKKTNILSLLYLLSSIPLILVILKYNSIESLIRYIIIGLLIIIDIHVLLNIKKKHSIFSNALKLTFIVVFAFLSLNLNKISNYLIKVNKGITYSSSLVTLKENNEKQISNDQKVGIITNEKESIKNKIIANNNLSNNEIIYYDNYHSLITSLYEEEINYAILPTDYNNIFSTKEGFHDINDRITIIATEEETSSKKSDELKSNDKKNNDPFSILLMGIDSTRNGLENSDSFNGDSLILLTFNPKTMNATMLSIHRDSYVPIMCFSDKHENKITHAASHGTKCVIDTVENYLDIDIDYYAKINFTGVVELVDTLGGIEVDVPYSLCEQDSQRRFGKNMIYVEKGLQTLNGEQALALARNRHKNDEYCSKKWTQGYRDVSVRSKNQEKIIIAIANKIKETKDISKIYELLDVLSNNIDTNMEKDDILSFYNLIKNVVTNKGDNTLDIERLEITGDGQMIYDENTRLTMWNFIPVEDSVKEVSKEMKANLELEENNIKEFSYSMEEGFKETIIGSEHTNYNYYVLLPNFTDMSFEEAEKWADKNNVTLKVKYVEKEGYRNGRIINQSDPYRKRIDKLNNKTVTITVVDNN